jgi:hypothetical protein
VLERHEFSSQAFVPMGGGGGRYLVLVCMPGAGESIRFFELACERTELTQLSFASLADGQPDLSTLRAFLATHAQGISYHPNIWHHPIIALDAVRPLLARSCPSPNLTFALLCASRPPTLLAWCTRRVSLVSIVRSRSLARRSLLLRRCEDGLRARRRPFPALDLVL